jgi:hypothetical protein
VLCHYFNYYPQGNGMDESNNKNLMNIIVKNVGENKKNWDNKIIYASWVDRITTKTSIGKIPFKLVYEMEEKLTIDIYILVIHLMQHFTIDQGALQ